MSALDALTPEQYAQIEEAHSFRRLYSGLVSRSLFRLLELSLGREVVNPAGGAGVPQVFTVPAGAIWELISVHTNFSTSAVVANRVVFVQVKDPDGGTIGVYYSTRSQAANGVNVSYTFAGQGASVQNSASDDPIPSPPLPLTAGCTVTVSAASIDLGDSFGQTIVLAREWSPPQIVHLARRLLTDLDSAGGIY